MQGGSASSKRLHRVLPLQRARRLVRPRMSSGVSVIIPTRDRGRLLADAVRSALTVPEPPLEVIVVDAGLDGRLVDALAELGARCGSSGRTQRRRRRNAGAAAATGEYLGFLDSDDLMLDGKTTCLVDALAADPTPRARPRHDRGRSTSAARRCPEQTAAAALVVRARAADRDVVSGARRLLLDVHVGDADPARARSRASAASTSRSMRTRTGTSTCASRFAGGSSTPTAPPRSTASGRATSAGGARPSGRFASRRSTLRRCRTSPRRSGEQARYGFLRRLASSHHVLVERRAARRSALAAVRLAPRRALRDSDVRRPLVRSFLPARILSRRRPA